jgi:hypothetical protein
MRARRYPAQLAEPHRGVAEVLGKLAKVRAARRSPIDSLRGLAEPLAYAFDVLAAFDAHLREAELVT